MPLFFNQVSISEILVNIAVIVSRIWTSHPQQSGTPLDSVYSTYRAFQVVLVVKNPSTNGGDTGDPSFIPGWEDPLEEEMATHSSILAWRIPWTEEPGRLYSMGSKSQTWMKWLSMHTLTHCMQLSLQRLGSYEVRTTGSHLIEDCVYLGISKYQH